MRLFNRELDRVRAEDALVADKRELGALRERAEDASVADKRELGALREGRVVLVGA